MYEAQGRQRALQNQITTAKAELSTAESTLEAAQAALREARERHHRAALELREAVRNAYKSGAPYGLYHLLESRDDLRLLREGAREELTRYRTTLREVEACEDTVSAAQYARDTLADRLSTLRSLLRTADAEVAQLRELTASDLSTAPTFPGAPDTGVRPGLVGGGTLRWPVVGPMTSGFGNRFDPYYRRWQLHAGIDIAARAGTPVRAAAAGVVIQAGSYGGYGNYICIAHGQVRNQEVTTCYGHLLEILVTVGQRVNAEQLIGLVGSTGASTGPHLHFEVRLGGRPTDPEVWL